MFSSVTRPVSTIRPATGDSGTGSASELLSVIASPRATADPAGFRYQVQRTLVYRDGTVHRSDWEDDDRPVTLGVRLVSVADDDIQHAGQAAFVRGVVENHG